MDLAFEDVYKIPLTCMTIIRSHPGIPKDIKWFSIFLLMHGICTLYFILFIYNIIYIDLKNNDLVTACKNGSYALVYVAVTFDYIIMLWKETLLKSLLKTVKTDYNNAKQLTPETQEIVLKYAQRTIWVNKLWCYEISGGIMIFPIWNVILHIYYYCIGEFRRIHVLDLLYPWSLNELKEKTYVFCIEYAFGAYFAVYCGVIYVAFVPMGPDFMLHACGQLEILTKRIDNVFSAQDITEELKSIIKELQRVYSYVEEIQSTFEIAYELLLKTIAVTLPIIMYEIVETFRKGYVPVEFFTFILGAILNITFPCYYGEILMEKGETLRMAVYFCGWERTYERRTRKMIALLLQRASRPIAIRSMFRNLCLDALTDVYHQSYAIFNLMNAVWN